MQCRPRTALALEGPSSWTALALGDVAIGGRNVVPNARQRCPQSQWCTWTFHGRQLVCPRDLRLELLGHRRCRSSGYFFLLQHLRLLRWKGGCRIQQLARRQSPQLLYSLGWGQGQRYHRRNLSRCSTHLHLRGAEPLRGSAPIRRVPRPPRGPIASRPAPD